MKPIYALAAALLAGCINPFEGDYGPVKLVSELDSCWVTVRETDSLGNRTRIYTTKRACDGAGHDWELMGWRVGR